MPYRFISNRFIPVQLLVLLVTSAGSTLAQSRPDLMAPPRVTLDVGANSVSWTAFPGASVPSPRHEAPGNATGKSIVWPPTIVESRGVTGVV